MNITLWILAGVLAAAFLASALAKLQPREKLIAGGFTWAEDYSSTQVKLIGLVEAAGAVGLVLPAAVGTMEVLSPPSPASASPSSCCSPRSSTSAEASPGTSRAR